MELLRRRVCALGIGLSIATAAQAGTIATFSDPSPGGSTSPPLFVVTSDIIAGGWTGSGLTLETPSGDFSDATFMMGEVPITGTTLGAGTIEFFDSAAALILTIDFDGGVLAPLGFGASEVFLDDVAFSSPAGGVDLPPAPLAEQTFAFSFANPAPTPGGTFYTASFTSSAIPEPATLALLAIGGFLVIRRRT